MPPKKKLEKAPELTEEQVKTAKELADRDLIIATLREAVNRFCLATHQARVNPYLFKTSLDVLPSELLNRSGSALFYSIAHKLGCSRHAGAEHAQKDQISALAARLRASEADLHDINEFLLNELKVPSQALCSKFCSVSFEASMLQSARVVIKATLHAKGS